MPQTQGDKLLDEFKKIQKRILKANLSNNPNTLERYRIDIINSNNKFINYVTPRYAAANRQLQVLTDNSLEYVRKQLIRCLDALDCEYEISEDLQSTVDPSSVKFRTGLVVHPDADIDYGDSDTDELNPPGEQAKEATDSNLIRDLVDSLVDTDAGSTQAAAAIATQITSAYLTSSNSDILTPVKVTEVKSVLLA